MLALLMAISRFCRARRMKRLLRCCAITDNTRILDVGGVPGFWKALEQKPTIVLLNVIPLNGDLSPATHAVAGDGRCLPFADKSFDLVVSNSAIEHVGNRESQAQFAAEIARVGKVYWVQTPNVGFPVEQHLFLPVVHWLPASWQALIVRRFTLWTLMGAPRCDRDFFAAHYLRDIRLLNAAELRSLFPSSRIIRESFLGMTKSLIAFGKGAE